jgi:HAE1 family hydrophobic/amphiphilic exporter-1
MIAIGTFGPIHAQETGNPQLPPRVGITSEVPISLDEVIERALASNTDIAVSRTARARAILDVAAAGGAYDPTVTLQTSYLRQVTPVSSLIGGSASGRLTQENFVLTPQVRGTVYGAGTEYQLSLRTQRLITDNQFITLNPQFPTTFTLSVTQPLFRGLAFDEPRRRIAVARLNDTLSDADLRLRVLDVSFRAEQAYWDLVAAEQVLSIQLQGLDLARQQVESNRRLAEQGVGAPIDVVEARTQAATVEQNVHLAQAALTRAENALKLLILPDRSSKLWLAALRPATAERSSADAVSLDDAVRRALASRPEMAMADVAAAANETNTRFFRDQAKPQIDLVGFYSVAGLAGRTVPDSPNPLTGGFQPIVDRINALSVTQGLAPLPSFGGSGSSVSPNLLGGYGQSFSTLFGQDFPTFEVGIQISLPLRNRAAEASLAASLVEGRRVDLERQRLEEAIEADVRNALQAVVSGRARLDAGAAARRMAEEQYESEQRRFQAGTSTVFLVVQRQTALIATRIQYAQAESDLNKARAALERATGQLFETHNIVIE